MTDPTPTNPVVADAKAVEAKAVSAVQTVATDVKASAGVVRKVYTAVKAAAPHIATATGGFVAGHYLGGAVFAVLKHIL